MAFDKRRIRQAIISANKFGDGARAEATIGIDYNGDGDIGTELIR